MIMSTTIKVGFKGKQNRFTKNESCQLTLRAALAQRIASHVLYHTSAWHLTGSLIRDPLCAQDLGIGAQCWYH